MLDRKSSSERESTTRRESQREGLNVIEREEQREKREDRLDRDPFDTNPQTGRRADTYEELDS